MCSVYVFMICIYISIFSNLNVRFEAGTYPLNERKRKKKPTTGKYIYVRTCKKERKNRRNI